MKRKLNQVKTFFSKPYNILLVLFLIVLTYLVVFPLFSIVKDTFIVHSAEKSRVHQAVGKNYTEELSAVNTGEVEEYIRVIVTRRWVKVVKNEDGSTTVTEIPETELDPALIRLSLKDTDWIVAPASGNKEQVVLYGKHIVKASETVMFNTEISVDPKVASILTHTELENGSVVSSYDYDADSVQLQLIAEVDAVQVNNAQDAILSAWGVKVNIADDGTLSLAE